MQLSRARYSCIRSHTMPGAHNMPGAHPQPGKEGDMAEGTPVSSAQEARRLSEEAEMIREPLLAGEPAWIESGCSRRGGFKLHVELCHACRIPPHAHA
jgi:hypothetical protein